MNDIICMKNINLLHEQRVLYSIFWKFRCQGHTIVGICNILFFPIFSPLCVADKIQNGRPYKTEAYFHAGNYRKYPISQYSRYVL